MILSTKYIKFTKGDFVDWGNVPPPKAVKPANPKTMHHGMPFEGKPVNRDYGKFGDFNDEPIKVEREPHKKY